MLTTIEFRTSQGELLSLPLGDESNGVVIESIEGLDPVKATLVSTSFSQVDGEQYHSSRREARNVKIKLGFEPEYILESIRDIRNRLYRIFMPKTEVSLRFINSENFGSDVLTVDIVGRVESFESPLFAQEPVVDISIMCFNPDLYDPNTVVIDGMSTTGTTMMDVDYVGNVDTGIEFFVLANRDLPSFTAYLDLPDGTTRVLQFNQALMAGDTLKISSVPGAKGITRSRAGNEDISLLYGMTPTSSWLLLQPGLNRIRVQAPGDPVPYRIEYTTKYGGL